MKKILVVEDEKNIILSLEMFIKKKGFEVHVVKNGVDAVKLAQEIIPDLILLDIVLPGMNGYLVCEALKDEDETKEIPIVFISAKSQEEDIKKAYDCGGVDYVIKPFNHSEIQEILNKYL
ncbi:MAG: response regulator [Tissierellales bacterium]|jgi:DNA-binding response OmpR family regulator|nr:response regulator [Tissierellales bacterium]HCX03877.1 response regulator [Clostridiales bacterium]